MTRLALGLAFAVSLLAADARAQTVCGDNSSWGTLDCGTYNCPDNTTCAPNSRCNCYSGYTAVTCAGLSCASASCAAPNWHCVSTTACGDSDAFNVVDCGGGSWCPVNSSCSGTGCRCNTGFESRNCSGVLCSGSCTAPNYRCVPTSSGTGGGGGGTGGGGGGTGGAGGGTTPITVCETGKRKTVASCGGDVCGCAAACTTNTECNSGCCSRGYCSLSCVCSGQGSLTLDCGSGGSGGSGGGTGGGSGNSGGALLQWGCNVSPAALLPLLALLLFRRRATR
jgi:hypothetical protein